MHLFEKIFNYQIISRVEDSGVLMITSHERAWLKAMLEHPAADYAFTSDTLEKLRSVLHDEAIMDASSYLIEKARMDEKQVYHPLLRPIRRQIMNKSGICLNYTLRNGQVFTGKYGFPYKLEYSMVKREWYLLWYNMVNNTLMYTKLKDIEVVAAESIEPSVADTILERIVTIIESRKREVLIEIVPLYNRELSRILYAFSSFEKTVEYNENEDAYTIRVTLLGNELEYLLLKIRFLGKRVRVIEGNYLKRRMLEASTKALERYGSSNEDM